MKYKKKYSAPLVQKAYEEAKKRCGSHRKLTVNLNQRISSGLLNKYSLEVIHPSLSYPTALRTLYKWLHNGWLSISLENYILVIRQPRNLLKRFLSIDWEIHRGKTCTY